MLSYPEALERLRALPLRGRREVLPLSACSGRVLAEPVRMDRDQPGFDRATMDGYALCLDGERTSFRVLDAVHAGEAHEGRLSPGEAVKIMTGAPCPPDVTVVQVEWTEERDGFVHVTRPAGLGPRRNIAWRGEDARAGDPVLAAGTRLAPATLAAAAMAGADELALWASPRLGVVTTGDEVGRAGPAGIRDSNGPLLVAFAAAAGCPVNRRHALDDVAELDAALAAAAAESDVLVTVGGVSMGDRDLVPGAVERLGFRTLFHRVAVQPGKPVLVAEHADGRLLLGLPGNPVSVLATAHLFLLPAIGRFLGGWEPHWLELPLAVDHAHRGDRHLFLPASLDGGGVRPVPWNGSGDLLAAAAGDGLVDLPAGCALRAGDPVRYLPYLGHAPGERADLTGRSGPGDCC